MRGSTGCTPRRHLGAIRFYVDADLLGTAKLLTAVRPDVTYPGDPGGRGPDGFERAPCPVLPGEKDVEWLPRVADAGWVTITRDRHIQHRPAEREDLPSAKARMIRLDARHGLNKWQQLEIIVTQWRRFEELAELPGPWSIWPRERRCARSSEGNSEFNGV